MKNQRKVIYNQQYIYFDLFQEWQTQCSGLHKVILNLSKYTGGGGRGGRLSLIDLFRMAPFNVAIFYFLLVEIVLLAGGTP